MDFSRPPRATAPQPLEEGSGIRKQRLPNEGEGGQQSRLTIESCSRSSRMPRQQPRTDAEVAKAVKKRSSASWGLLLRLKMFTIEPSDAVTEREENWLSWVQLFLPQVFMWATTSSCGVSRLASASHNPSSIIFRCCASSAAGHSCSWS